MTDLTHRQKRCHHKMRGFVCIYCGVSARRLAVEASRRWRIKMGMSETGKERYERLKHEKEDEVLSVIHDCEALLKSLREEIEKESRICDTAIKQNDILHKQNESLEARVKEMEGRKTFSSERENRLVDGAIDELKWIQHLSQEGETDPEHEGTNADRVVKNLLTDLGLNSVAAEFARVRKHYI